MQRFPLCKGNFRMYQFRVIKFKRKSASLYKNPHFYPKKPKESHSRILQNFPGMVGGAHLFPAVWGDTLLTYHAP